MPMRYQISTFVGPMAIASVLSLGAAGCSSHVLKGGVLASHNVLQGDAFQITIAKLSSGAYWTNVYAEVTVKNSGTAEAVFDPGEVELSSPQTGITYFHITKDKSSVSVPPGMANLLSKTTMRPGQAIRGILLYPTAQGGSKEIQQIEVTYRGQKLHFPSGAADAKP